MITVVVEGESDTAVAHKIVNVAGGSVAKVHVTRGKATLDTRIPKYALAAKHTPWVIFRDSDSACPVELVSALTTGLHIPPSFRLRIADSMTESWLLADAANFAKYFGVSRAKVPREPDSSSHAKRELIAICAQSRKRDIREGIVAATINPAPRYVQLINQFARERWDPIAAANASRSLAGAIRSVSEMIGAVSEM